jgi:hypothetical protein
MLGSSSTNSVCKAGAECVGELMRCTSPPLGDLWRVQRQVAQTDARVFPAGCTLAQQQPARRRASRAGQGHGVEKKRRRRSLIASCRSNAGRGALPGCARAPAPPTGKRLAGGNAASHQNDCRCASSGSAQPRTAASAQGV